MLCRALTQLIAYLLQSPVTFGTVLGKFQAEFWPTVVVSKALIDYLSALGSFINFQKENHFIV